MIKVELSVSKLKEKSKELRVVSLLPLLNEEKMGLNLTKDQLTETISLIDRAVDEMWKRPGDDGDDMVCVVVRRWV